MVNSDLSSAQLLVALKTSHMPTISYLFHGSSLHPSFLISETNFLNTAIIPKLVINRYFLRALRHLPQSRLGLELSHLYFEKGLIRLKQLIENIRQNTKVGEQLIINLQWAQLISGLEKGI